MSIARTITSVLTGVMPEQLQDLEPKERQALSDQLRRVYRIVEGDRIIAEAAEATAPKDGVLALLRAGERAP